MALVKCPECGRENVSDTAEACPNCGFNIKLYYGQYILGKPANGLGNRAIYQPAAS